MSKRLKICILTVIFVFLFIYLFICIRGYGGGKYWVSIPMTHTKSVDGQTDLFFIRSDLIINVPEDFDYKSLIGYDKIIEVLGKPSGSYGSGVVWYYWRIGEDKYLTYPGQGTLFLVGSESKKYNKEEF